MNDVLDPADAGDPPTVPDPNSPPASCGTCRNWHIQTDEIERGPAGQCRADPPDVPTTDFRTTGRIHVYPLTLAGLPACGLFTDSPAV